MKTINRSAVVVRYRQPYLEWADQVFPEESEDTEGMREAISVYLVPPDPADEQEAAPIEEWFTQAFEHELESWCADRARWPATRELATFLDWFEVGEQSLVIDLASGPIWSERM